MSYKVINTDGKDEQTYDTYKEALEYVLKMGDRNKLGKIVES